MWRSAICVALLAASLAAAQPRLDREDPAERARIQRWLSQVEAFLRGRDVSRLTSAQRERRALHLQHLRAYWKAGRFPHNHVAPGLTPVFIDEHGTACAVGQLLIEGGAAQLAHQIARDHLLARLPELDSPALRLWAAKNGFTLAELALIQPSYDSDPSHPERQFNVCFREAPSLLRYEGGWKPVSGPLDRLHPEYGRREEFPWLVQGEGEELWLISRGGEGHVWNGREFAVRLPVVQEHHPFALATLPSAKEELMLTLSTDSTQEYGPISFLVRAGPGGLTTQEKLEGTFSPEIYSLWRDRGAGTVFGVGREGAIIRRTPYESWVVLSTPTKAPLLDVDGSSERDLWAVGGAGVALHFDGAQWQRVETGTQEGLLAVAAASRDDVWAVGTRGTALHFDGTAWQPVETGISQTLRAVAVRDGEVWLGGDEGVILHRTGGAWRREDVPTPFSIMSFGIAEGVLFATTNAQTPCAASMVTRIKTKYHRGTPTTTMLFLGAMQAGIHWLLSHLDSSEPTHAAPISSYAPTARTCAVILAVTPLLLLVAWVRRRPRRWLHWGVGLALMVPGAWLIWESHTSWGYWFTFTSGAGDWSLTREELTRVQDTALLEYDLAVGATQGEASALVSIPRVKFHGLVVRDEQLTSPRGQELRARYARFFANPQGPPYASLGKCEERTEAQMSRARCAGADSSWLPKPPPPSPEAKYFGFGKERP